MDLTTILEYQKMDGELYSLETKLARSENKKKCIALSGQAKEAQQKSSVLEERAGEALKELEEAKKVLVQNTKLADALVKKDLEKESAEDIENDISFKEKLFSNLSFLDKKITKIAESINAILSEYNKMVKTYNDAKAKYRICKEAYDKEMAELEPKMKEIEQKLQIISKKVDAELLAKYVSMRKDKKYPIFVPLIGGNTCGHCRMEISASEVSKLNREGMLTCEHCRRILYKNN